ncbi:Ribosome-binding factor A [Taenia solium]|eukprot:TsM_000966800 transcript=TsM_000966800 gene=TsM_000966800
MMRMVFRAEWFIAASTSRTFVGHRLIPYSSLPPKVSDDLLSEISTQTRHEDAHLMRKYKRRLSMILASTDADEPLSQVMITNLATSPDGRILTIFWTIAEHPHSDITARKVDVILQNSSKSIRQRLARENVFRKVPILNFIHAPSVLPPDTSKGQIDVESCHIVKPNNVYGLPWDEYMNEVKRKRQVDVVMVDSENADADCQRDRGSCPSQAAIWARMWHKQHNSRLVAKRERKRSQQMLGMWQLSKEMEELD